MTSVNRVIRALILSDFFLFFGLGLLAPIFAVFILEHIDNRLEVIGLAAAIYWVTRMLLVIPLSKYMDTRSGSADEYLLMILGTMVISLVPLGYSIAASVWHIYGLQALYGLGSAMAVPAWRILFTNNVDRAIIGFEWSLEDVSVGFAMAASAVLGALIADYLGFDALFLLVSLFGFSSALVLLYLYRTDRARLIACLSDSRAPLKIDTIK